MAECARRGCPGGHGAGGRFRGSWIRCSGTGSPRRRWKIRNPIPARLVKKKVVPDFALRATSGTIRSSEGAKDGGGEGDCPPEPCPSGRSLRGTPGSAFRPCVGRPSRPAALAARLRAGACLSTKRVRYPASAVYRSGAPVRRAFPPARRRPKPVQSPRSSGIRKRWWRRRGLNPRPPRCERGALPAELLPHLRAGKHFRRFAPALSIRAPGKRTSLPYEIRSLEYPGSAKLVQGHAPSVLPSRYVAVFYDGERFALRAARGILRNNEVFLRPAD